MEQKRTLSSWISARRYIRDFAADYAARHGENAAEIEKDILQAKKINHISLNEYEWVGYHDRTEAQKRTMSTLWTRAEFRKNFTDRRYIAILMNKYIFSKVFSDFYGRRCVQASAVDAVLCFWKVRIMPSFPLILAYISWALSSNATSATSVSFTQTVAPSCSRKSMRWFFFIFFIFPETCRIAPVRISTSSPGQSSCSAACSRNSLMASISTWRTTAGLLL